MRCVRSHVWQRLMLAANTLMKQEEFQRVPMESTWLATGRKGPDYMAWTPPFGFGNEDDFRYSVASLCLSPNMCFLRSSF